MTNLSVKKDQRGIILVMTLIIMAILLSVAIGFGVVIISDIRQAASIDNSIIAYFAADAGLERNLFLLRKQEDVKSINDLISKTGNLAGSDSDWNISSSTNFEPTFLRQRIKNGQSVKLFFLNRDTETDPNAVESISVDWNKSLLSPTKMQISFTRLKPETDGVVYKTDQNLVALSTTSDCYNFLDLPSKSDYVVEIKALGSSDGYIDDLKVIGYDGECNDDNREKIDNAISNLTLISEGLHGNSKQRIIAHLPPRTPVSGIFSFVLFSEEDITKK